LESRPGHQNITKILRGKPYDGSSPIGAKLRIEQTFQYMSFFTCNKETKTADLKLSDYNQIWTKFCFLDETGSLANNSTDPFFTIGIIKMSQPYYLLSKFYYERTKRRFYDEIKFNKLSKSNVDFAKMAIGAFLNARSTYFYSYAVDKGGSFFKKEYGGDQWNAYELLTLRLLKEAVLAPKEILILIADYITVPNHVRYEVNVKKGMNESSGYLCLAGVCRFDSKSNDLLQVVDLIIGAINYDLKLSTGFVTGDKYKIELLEFLKKNLGVKSLMDGFRNRNFNIFVDKDIKLRLKKIP